MEELLQKSLHKENLQKPFSKSECKNILEKEPIKKVEKENRLSQKQDLPMKVSKPESKKKSAQSAEDTVKDAKKSKWAKHDGNFAPAAFSALETGTGVFVLDNFSGLYSPAKVVSRASRGSECYNVLFFTGKKEVCHRKYILTNRDPKFYSATVVPIEKVNETLDPELSQIDRDRIIAVVGQHHDVLKSIILGKTTSLRDRIYLFDHLKRVSLFTMSRPSPFRQSEFAFLCKYLSLDFIDECLLDDPTFKDAVAARFASAGHSLNMTMPNYALLVLAPELLIRIILKQYKQLKTLEEASEFYLQHTFETETSYVALMYASREMYRYNFSESKTKI